jgi:hypothetical protein
MSGGPDENRGSVRYQAMRGAVYLGWWDEPDFRTCAARLQNLSHGGALVDVALAPPEGSSLWLCAGGTPPGQWVEGEVVAREAPGPAAYRLHLRFPETCPYELFEAAVLGIETGA